MIHPKAVSTWFNLPSGKLLLLLVFSIFLTACQNRTTANNTPAQDKGEQEYVSLADTITGKQPVGGQKDEHGCLVAAGYTWSQVKQQCVRIFEEGIRLNPQDPGIDQTTSAFIIFSDDQLRAELFMPATKGSLVLERTGSEGNYRWNGGDYSLSAWKGYVLKAGNRALYHGP